MAAAMPAMAAAMAAMATAVTARAAMATAATGSAPPYCAVAPMWSSYLIESQGEKLNQYAQYMKTVAETTESIQTNTVTHCHFFPSCFSAMCVNKVT
jgi:predicted RecB family nuclease